MTRQNLWWPACVSDYPFYDPEVQLLANRGYTVLQVNFCGSSGFGGKFERPIYLVVQLVLSAFMIFLQLKVKATYLWDFAALKKVSNDPQWLYIGDAGHGVFSIKNRKIVYEKVLKFLDEDFGGDLERSQ